MTSGYHSRFERRDLVLATITAIIAGVTVVMAVTGVLLLLQGHL